MQATVSDKKLAILDGDGYRRAFHASLPAAYDYYPFGMLMKERTSMDTGEHPSYMSAVVSVPIVNGGLVALNSTNCGVAYGATLSYGSGVTMNGTNGELSVVLSGLTPGLPVTAKVVISYLADNAQLSAMDSAGTAMLASTAVTGNAEWTIVFTPVEGRTVLKVGLFPYLARPSKLLEVLRVSWEQQVGVDYRTQLVRVGTRTGDRYEFGFNGQMKDNEVAGLGNHLDFGARLFSPRYGRFFSRDPLANKSLDETPYLFAGDNPLYYIDKEGKLKVPADKVSQYKRDYPKIMAYLASQVEKDYANSPEILGAFVAVNKNLSTETIKGIVRWGSGPTIVFEEAPGPVGKGEKDAAGYTDPDIRSQEIQLNARYARRLEKILASSASSREKQVAFMRFYMTLTHELGHQLNKYGLPQGTNKDGNTDYKYRVGGVIPPEDGEVGDMVEEIIWGYDGITREGYRPNTKHNNNVSGGVEGIRSRKYVPTVTEGIIDNAESTPSGKRTLPTTP